MKINLWFYILLFITACSPSSQEKIVLTPTTGITDPTSLPTSTFTPPTETALPTFTPVPIVPFSIDALRMVYGRDGNIHVRDGLNPPKQLTFSGRDRDPILSDDGEKIIFYRGEEDDHVYSINVDGSSELLIIESKSMPAIGRGEIKALTFVPNSHIVLFNTYLCNPHPTGPSYNAASCTVGLYRVGPEAGKFEAIVDGQSGSRIEEGNFEVSPNGELITVAAAGHVDVYYFSQWQTFLKIPDAVTYYRTLPDEYLAKQYWLPDSSGFISIVAEYGSSNEPTTPPLTYTAFRYLIDGEQAIPILLDQTITRSIGYESWALSLDRNWIYFSTDNSFPSLIGNLTTGHTQLTETGIASDHFSWGPDSTHFSSLGGSQSIESREGSSIPLDGFFIQWLDATHYLYVTTSGKPETFQGYIGEIGGEAVSLPDDFTLPDDFVVLGPSPAP